MDLQPRIPRSARCGLRSLICQSFPVSTFKGDLQWIYTAASVAMAFLIMAIPFNALACWLTLRRRVGTLSLIQARGDLGVLLRGPVLTPALHATTSVLLLIAFASFIGITNANYDRAAFLRLGELHKPSLIARPATLLLSTRIIC